jgi:hypothetical protein
VNQDGRFVVIDWAYQLQAGNPALSPVGHEKASRSLEDLTTRLLECALEGELTEHLG